jgi:hypothetical protein
MKIYVPFNDKELVVGAELAAEASRGQSFVHGVSTLNSITARDTLYVIGHGRYSRGDQICGTVRGRISGTRTITMTANELASQLLADGLTKTLGDLRLMMCWSGYSGPSIKFAGHDLTRDAQKPPFAAQLCSVLKAKGFTRIIVTGYTGEVVFAKDRTVVPVGIWLTNKNNNLVQTTDSGSQTLTDLLNLAARGAQGGTGTLSNASRTVWY